MSKAARAGQDVGLVPRVRAAVTERLERVAVSVGAQADLSRLVSGKMLRSRLADRLVPACSGRPSDLCVARLAAAVELVHSASLCHDDVIDNAVLRRAAPTLWRRTSESGAVLIGDMLLCEAIDLLLSEAAAKKAAWLSEMVTWSRQVRPGDLRWSTLSPFVFR